ncbi:hypothetical protein DY000_02013022 [Brassica cretica]|uniref:Cytochrome P450 n=1 Tax=Brassica cretica TaxID=69181 RepID=A0ABQ7D2H6_BRACR|nr:hypothetical protein DY000_02013022 [Brassica cretica]
MLSSNFPNYPRGRKFKKIFDILGDGIIPADRELWEDLRKSGHALFHHQNFLKLTVSSTTSKLKNDLVPLLDQAAEENIIIDLQDVFKRFMFDTASILMTGDDPMSLSTEMPGNEFGEAADFAEEATFYRYFKPMILWRLQNLIGIGTERKIRTASEIFNKNGGLKREPSSKFLVFSAGPRTCLGKQLALLQMKMVVVEIIQNYDFKVVDNQKIEPVPSVILRIKHGLKVTVSKNI